MTDLGTAYAQINQLYGRYTDAVWRKDIAAFGGCFIDDGEWRISGMVFSGRKEIAAGIGRIMENFNRVLISFRAPIVEIGEAGATGRIYVTEQCAWKDGSTNISIGTYFDRYAFDNGHCLFSWRLFQLHYRGPENLDGTFFENPDFGPPPAMPPLDAMTGDHASRRWGLTDLVKP